MAPVEQEQKRWATYEDLCKVPDHLVAEILDGDLITSPRPASRHAQATTQLIGDLRNPFGRGKGGPGGWLLLFEPELHLGRDILVPDLAGWRRERMPEMPDAPFFTLAPDWVCEVLSPSTARIDRSRKLRIYAREQVTFAWLIDPLAETLEVLVRDGTRWTIVAVHEREEKVRAVPFDAVELELALLWAR